MKAPYYFSFDVESDGLFGKAFAVGWVIVNGKGEELEEGYLGCPAYLMSSEEADMWVIQNVIPALPRQDPFPCGAPWANCDHDYAMLVRFWEAWTEAKKDYPGIVMVTDCPFPVEAGFLLNAVKEYRPQIPMDESPYPIIDVATALVMLGEDPLEEYARRATELPKHNPVCDARQSVRIFIDCLKQCVHTKFTTGDLPKGMEG